MPSEGSRGFVLSVEGVNLTLTTHSYLTGSYATSLTETRAVIENPPDEITTSVDPETGSLDAGGLSIRCTDLEEFLTQRSTGPFGILASEVSRAATTWELEDASMFSPGDRVWCGRECAVIGGISGSDLIGMTRPSLGTKVGIHPPSVKVYSFNPVIETRRCFAEWIDLQTGTRLSRWQGQIERCIFDGKGWILTITNLQKRVSDGKALAAPFSQGVLLTELVENGPKLDIEMGLDDKERPIDDHRNTGHGKFQLRIDDEVLEVTSAIHPAKTTLVTNAISPYRLEADSGPFEVDEMVDIIDPSGDVIVEAAVIKAIAPGGSPTTTYFDFNTDMSGVIPSYSMVSNYRVLIPRWGYKRGAAGTKSADHSVGTPWDEIRIIEGDQVDILLWLLCSDEGDGSNGPGGGIYDVLPPGWGLALPADMVDLTSLLELRRERSYFRRYPWTDVVDVLSHIQTMSFYTNSFIFYDENGVCRAAMTEDVFPRDSQVHELGQHNSREKTPVDFDLRYIKNLWNVETDFSLDADRPKHVITIQDFESRHLRGDLEVNKADVQDLGLLKASGDAQIYTVARSFIALRSKPLLIARTEALLYEGVTYRVGQTAIVTDPMMPNMKGGSGVTGWFRIIEVSASPASGYVSLILMEQPQDRRLGYVSISGLVESAGGSDIVLEPASVSHFSPQSNLAFLPISGEPGLEDVDWFLGQDEIKLWDVSTFGSTGATTASRSIDSIDYPSRTLTLSTAVPAWLAQGDLVRLASWSVVRGSPTGGERIDVFLALADSTLSPPDLSGDEAYEWGM